MPISLFVQDLRSFSADRARRLNAQFGIARCFVLVWPEYDPPVDPIPRLNRETLTRWSSESGVPVWGWMNAKENQHADAAQLINLTAALPALKGWLLDIEGEWSKSAKLTTLLAGAKQTGLPTICSLAATTPSHVSTDFRSIDLAGYPVDWQCYFDSGEGQDPATCVREAYQSSFVIPGWEYRALWGTASTWGTVHSPNEAGTQAAFNAMKRAGSIDGYVKTRPREWGLFVADDRTIRRAGSKVGTLMGRVQYKNIRVTLDVTRGADQKHTPAEWTAIAASARVPGSKKRPVSVYLADNASDETLAGIAAGAP